MIHPEKHTHLSFPIKASTHKKALKMIDKLHAAEDKREHAQELMDLITEISHEGLEFFFITPLKLAKVNAFSRKAVQMGVNTGQRAVIAVAGKIVKSMSDKQLHVITDFMENLIYPRAE